MGLKGGAAWVTMLWFVCRLMFCCANLEKGLSKVQLVAFFIGAYPAQLLISVDKARQQCGAQLIVGAAAAVSRVMNASLLLRTLVKAVLQHQRTTCRSSAGTHVDAACSNAPE